MNYERQPPNSQHPYYDYYATGATTLLVPLNYRRYYATGATTIPALLHYRHYSKINDHKSKTNIQAPIIYFANLEIQSEPMLGNQLVSFYIGGDHVNFHLCM